MADNPSGDAHADDKALMLRFEEHGDLPAFEQLFRRHRVHLFRYLRGLARSNEVAEEISQHAWLKVIEAARARKYSAVAHSTFKTWLYTLARNQYVDTFVRAHGVSKTVSESDVGETMSEPTEDPQSVDRRADLERVGEVLDRAIDRLPDEQRDVVLLWAQGHELTAIAEISGVSWETVISRKKYAVAKLRHALAASGIAQGDM